MLTIIKRGRQRAPWKVQRWFVLLIISVTVLLALPLPVDWSWLLLVVLLGFFLSYLAMLYTVGRRR